MSGLVFNSAICKSAHTAAFELTSYSLLQSQYIKKMDLGGGMIWALDLDDFTNRCGCGKHPLLKTINHELRGLQASTSDCT